MIDKNKGFVALWRDIENWEWADEPTTFWFFMRLILMANHEEKKWRGTVIPRGSFVSSRANLAEKLHLSVQRIRTLVNRLISTGELTIKTTSKYTMYTIVKYTYYQNKKHKKTSETTSKSTNKQPASDQTNNQQVTTTKQCKQLNNENNITPNGVSTPEKKQTKIQEVLTYFAEQYENYLGEPVKINWGKDGALAKGILATYGDDVEKVKSFIKRYFELEDAFLDKAGRTFGLFNTTIPKVIISLKTEKEQAAKPVLRDPWKEVAKWD